MTSVSFDPCTVLVAQSLGAEILGADPRLQVVNYQLGDPPTPQQQAAQVLVLDPLPPVEPVLALIAQLPRLRLVQLLVAGFEPWVGRLPTHLAMANARGAHGGAVAEWVVAVLLAHYRELGAFAAAQREQRWDQHLTSSLAGKAIAVIGAGDIAQHLQRMLTPFGSRVTLVGRTAREGIISLHDLAAIQHLQDAIVLALPVSSESQRMVGTAFLAAMKDGAVLINAGRGALVDTPALLAETARRRLHAILDVTDPEPPPPGHPLWTSPNVTFTPHVAGGTEGCWTRSWRVAARQIDAYLAGQEPENTVIRATR